MAGQPLRIGALAQAAGVGIETIRYYQRRRLLDTPARALGGQRSYPSEFVDRLRFIKRAQGLGFSLADIAALLQLNDGTDHVRARQLASARLAEIESRVADLAAMRDVLARLIRHCQHAEGRVPCPIIATLLRDELPATKRARRPATARPRTSTTVRGA